MSLHSSYFEIHSIEVTKSNAKRKVGIRAKTSKKTMCNYMLFCGRPMLLNIEINTEEKKISGK